MKTIFQELIWALRALFGKRKHKVVLLGLVLLSAAISIAELAVAKAFTQIALAENKIDDKTLVLLIVAFFFFFALTRVGHFAQRLYRLKVFEKYMRIRGKKKKGRKESWSWSLALELSNILGALTQIIVISILFVVFSPIFVLINFIVLILVTHIFGRLYRKQLSEQRRFVDLAKAKTRESSAVTVTTRIKSGELGGLYSGIGMMVLMGTLLYLSYVGDISPSDTVILFFGLRMQNGNYTTISKGLMRFARARAHCE